MIHLRSVALDASRASVESQERYPFTVPAVAALSQTPLRFDAAVTYLVGENGTGKSALLEGMACAAGSAAVAGDDPQRDPTLTLARELGKALRLTWSARTRQGFFLRAEDFFGYAKYISSLKSGLEDDLAEFDATTGALSYGGRIARGAYLREIG